MFLKSAAVEGVATPHDRSQDDLIGDFAGSDHIIDPKSLIAESLAHCIAPVDPHLEVSAMGFSNQFRPDGKGLSLGWASK